MTAARFSDMNFIAICKPTLLSVTKFKISLGDTQTYTIPVSAFKLAHPSSLSKISPPPPHNNALPPVVKIKLINSTFYLLYADENKSI